MSRVGSILTMLGLGLMLLAGCQKHEDVEARRSLIVDDEPKEVRVGLLLPLTGPAADIGEDMLKATQMALFDSGETSIVLLPRDTGSSAEGAAIAARQLLNEDVKILIGPLYTNSVQAVTPLAQRANVPVLAFSPVAEVATDNIYVLGFRPEEQVDRIVRYALKQGLKTFAGLAPDDASGKIAMQTLQKVVTERGGIMGEVHFYSPTLDDPSPAVREVANYRERQAALDHERRLLEAMGEDDEVAQAVLRQIEPQDTFGEPPFDAILIADGGNRLRSVASILTFYDVDPENVQFLGTNLWHDDIRILGEDALAGGWYTAPSAVNFDSFEERFTSAFSSSPNFLASLAYDATVLAVLVENDLENHSFDHAELADSEGFVGATGLFRLKPNGLVQHSLSVLRITNGDTNEIDPAPVRFDDAFFDTPSF